MTDPNAVLGLAAATSDDRHHVTSSYGHLSLHCYSGEEGQGERRPRTVHDIVSRPYTDKGGGSTDDLNTATMN